MQFNKNFANGVGGTHATTPLDNIMARRSPSPSPSPNAGARHRDDKDASYQVATAFGDYSGGELRVYGQDGVVDCNTQGRFSHHSLGFSFIDEAND